MDQRLQDVNSHDGFNKSIGVKIIDWQDGAGTVTLTPDLNHANRRVDPWRGFNEYA